MSIFLKDRSWSISHCWRKLILANRPLSVSQSIFFLISCLKKLRAFFTIKFFKQFILTETQKIINFPTS